LLLIACASAPSRANVRVVEVVGVTKIKRPIGSGSWRAVAIADDDHGQWLYTPPGSVYVGWDGERATEWEVGRGNRTTSPPVIQLMPRIGWWTACWYGRGGYERGHAGDPLPSISVDVCTPPGFADGVWSYVDLELDPIRNEHGVVWVDDEDEFEAACRAGLISATEEREARRTADQIQQMLEERAEPFGNVGWDHLERAIGYGLPPLAAQP